MAWLYKTDGSEQEVLPQNGKDFTLEELQKFVGGTIDIVPLPNGTDIVVNDNGKLEGLPVNEKACKLWQMAYPIELYPHNNDQTIVGDCLVVKNGEVK